MIIRLKKINLIILILFFFLGSLEANQIFDIKKSVKDNEHGNFISEFGDPEKDSKVASYGKNLGSSLLWDPKTKCEFIVSQEGDKLYRYQVENDNHSCIE